MKHIVCLTLLASLTLASAQSRIFGLDIGSSYSEVAKGTKLIPSTSNKNWYFTTVVPTPNRAFEEYGVFISPTYGLCAVIGFGRENKNDESGSEARSVYSSLQSTLIAKYGQGTKFEYLTSGSLWTKTLVWAMGVYKNDRKHKHFWDRTDATLPSDLDGIVLSVTAPSYNSTMVSLRYESVNFKGCDQQANGTPSDGL